MAKTMLRKKFTVKKDENCVFSVPLKKLEKNRINPK